MGFMQELSTEFVRLFTVYDFAAFCYDYLIKNVGDQAKFLGRYIMENKDAKCVNPNLQQLRNLNSGIEHVLRKREELGMPFPECMKEVISYLVLFTLEKYEEPLLNDATVPFFVLLAIDRYVREKNGRCSDAAPLNKEYSKDSYIYLNTQESILDEAAEENNFSDVIYPPFIRNQMQNLIILEKRELPQDIEPPRVVNLWIDDANDERMRIIAEKKLKIAVIPFGVDDMLDFPIDAGALFHVEYRKEHLETGSERAEKMLELAVKGNANIIIFPEYICDQKIRHTIQSWLEDKYEKSPEKMSSLFLVVAGSGWTEDGNNVSYIYSYSGRLIGKQYKNCRYSNLKHKGQEMIENLEKPGRESTIVDVEGIGKVLVGICRDISERAYTKMMAGAFRPQFLLVPAWSPSVNIGFKEQFKEITAQNHKTCSILCNCCAALDNKRKQTGIIVTPYKNESVIEGKVNMISRKQECVKKCKDTGCIFILDMNFNSDAVMEGKIISDRNMKQEFVSQSVRGTCIFE